MNQVQKILNYIDQFGSISSMEAFMDLGITRLAARISDIEHMGITIDHEMETSANRFGDKVHYTRYRKHEEASYG